MRGAQKALGRHRVGEIGVINYSPELGLRICEDIAAGKLIREVEGTDGIPTYATIMRWAVLVPEFGDALRAAREMSAFSLEEEAIDLGRQLAAGGANAVKINAFKTLMEQLRWSATKRNPRTFSERGAMTVTVPIQINTSLGLDPRAEAPEVETSVYTIEAQVEQEPDPDNGFSGLDPAPEPGAVAGGEPKTQMRRLRPPGSGKGPRKRVLVPPDPDYLKRKYGAPNE